jgi:hypothetical protein
VLSPDPHRSDALTWITAYAAYSDAPGVPIAGYVRTGRSGFDLRMFFSWYSGDFTADPEFADPSLSPEQRANPSFASLPDGGVGYLAQQRARLPTTTKNDAVLATIRIRKPSARCSTSSSIRKIPRRSIPGG